MKIYFKSAGAKSLKARIPKKPHEKCFPESIGLKKPEEKHFSIQLQLAPRNSKCQGGAKLLFNLQDQNTLIC